MWEPFADEKLSQQAESVKAELNRTLKPSLVLEKLGSGASAEHPLRKLDMRCRPGSSMLSLSYNLIVILRDPEKPGGTERMDNMDNTDIEKVEKGWMGSRPKAGEALEAQAKAGT